jgi:5-methylcytosine-specific restriction endonuclease McrA
MVAHSTTYRRYLASPAWQRKRRAALRKAGQRCQACRAGGALEVHHMHYRTLGHESLRDLRVLCHPCHVRADALRARATAQKQQAHYWEARVEGWAVKRYGAGWEGQHTFEEVADAFDAWLKRKGLN